MTEVPEAGSIAVFALTRGGATIAARVAGLLPGSVLHLPETLASGAAAGNLGSVRSDVPVRAFPRVGPALRAAFAEPAIAGLVCVMASGVVVRSLAPVLHDKRRDPAVLVLDEAGRFVVPVLSGHLGGANALACRLAEGLGAQAVLTTSSDVQGLYGPDLLARDLEARPANPSALLPVTSALVNRGTLDVWFDPEELGEAAEAIRRLEGYRVRPLDELADPVSGPGIAVTTRARPKGAREEETGAADVLHLVPRWISAGVGCKRGTSADTLLSAVRSAFGAAGRDQRSLRCLASARLKADEPGLAAAAQSLGVPALFAPDEELARVIAVHGLAESAFVREQAGVGAVAEPAALWAAGPGGRLVLEKQAGDGVTVALAIAEGGTMVRSEDGRRR